MLRLQHNLYNINKRLISRSSKIVDEIIRVDHAGELGADRIYAGQMAVLGKKLFCYLK